MDVNQAMLIPSCHHNAAPGKALDTDAELSSLVGDTQQCALNL